MIHYVSQIPLFSSRWYSILKFCINCDRNIADGKELRSSQGYYIEDKEKEEQVGLQCCHQQRLKCFLSHYALPSVFLFFKRWPCHCTVRDSIPSVSMHKTFSSDWWTVADRFSAHTLSLWEHLQRACIKKKVYLKMTSSDNPSHFSSTEFPKPCPTLS